VLLAVFAIGITSRAYRIGVEEKMLEASFGQEYKIYSDKTCKLFPFLY
jgi:protein-S-isoprenylcysteine O-methyltransferase Ste14